MKNVYDNGYNILGKVENVIQYLRENMFTSDMEEEIYELINDLENSYHDTDIVFIDYDRPMGGYGIDRFDDRDIVMEEI